MVCWSCGSRAARDSSKPADDPTIHSQESPVTTQSRVPCLSPDSGTLAYGTIAVDSSGETGDASGIQYTFNLEGDSLRGFVRDATGEIPPRLPLKDVHTFANGDSLSFVFGDEGDQNIHRYRFSCDALTRVIQKPGTPGRPGRTSFDTLRRSVPITAP
jgi:hypothetical protein